MKRQGKWFVSKYVIRSLNNSLNLYSPNGFHIYLDLLCKLWKNNKKHCLLKKSGNDSTNTNLLNPSLSLCSFSGFPNLTLYFFFYTFNLLSLVVPRRTTRKRPMGCSVPGMNSQYIQDILWYYIIIDESWEDHFPGSL